MNDAPAHHAPCDGTVYAWHYCYYPIQNSGNLEVAFGAYRYNTGSNRFMLRSGSHYLLHLDSREESFTCGTVTLSYSQQFQIKHGDRVGAWLRDNNGVEFLDILATNASDDVFVAMWGGSSGSCGQGNMGPSPQNPETESRVILHLYVDISKL